jgi:tryptophan synthase alpha chain
MARSIRQTFGELRQSRRIGLVAFVPAGYPDIATTPAILTACDQAGASVIEVGFPFSDPIADGPIIQEAFTDALANKVHVTDVFQAIKSVSPKLASPLVAMISYSIVFRYGLGRFLADAKAARFAGLILPDLPPPEAASVCEQTRAAGLETILLIAPTTPPARREEIVKLCSGFVYYLSVSGVTGERDALPPDLAANVAEIKTLTDLPVCVGFGIHQPRQIAELAKIADGAIVGSAIVRRLKEHRSDNSAVIAAAAGDYVRHLLAGAGGE